MSWLYATRHQGPEPAQALALLADTARGVAADETAGGVGLVYAPTSYAAVRFDGSELVGSNGAVDLASAFELRVTAAGVELRWVRGTPHRAALRWIDDSGDVPADGGTPVDVVAGQYLLWGTVRSSTGGWSTLYAARIGELHVPVGARRGARLRWCTRRCHAQVDAGEGNGNVYLAAELLGELEELN